MKYQIPLIAIIAVAAMNVFAAMPAAAQPICNMPSLFTLPDLDIGIALVSQATTLRGAPCPKINTRDCRARAKVKAGLTVATGPTHGPFTCVAGDGELAGWILSSQLRRQKVAKLLPLSSWVGNWKSADDEIDVALENDHLRAKGNAFNRSKASDEKHLPIGPDIGHFELVGIPKKDVLWGDKNCGIELMLLGSYLLVDDRNDCSDNSNITFRGIYKQPSLELRPARRPRRRASARNKRFPASQPSATVLVLR